MLSSMMGLEEEVMIHCIADDNITGLFLMKNTEQHKSWAPVADQTHYEVVQ